jgi:predicted house-cleaning noncanonical NTP pyrophosphatase (MazG superfamily)
MKFEKLVRDKIPEIIESKGETAITHIAEESEYKKKLREKLDEEIAEFDKNPSSEELADIEEVLHALAKVHDIGWDRVKEVQKKKAKERGGFTERIILDETKAA